ncbi:hypothetical protein ARZXY2_4490 (plasmid) [Arthrobacter sp. ZXY-2]|nr:hypothetical protein ARZXY2_4490 [Arthrobacter sp. ZXY-2]
MDPCLGPVEEESTRAAFAPEIRPATTPPSVTEKTWNALFMDQWRSHTI